MDMQIDILTLFPESVDAMLNVSILGRAQERGYIAIRTHQIRAYTTNKQMQVYRRRAAQKIKKKVAD